MTTSEKMSLFKVRGKRALPALVMPMLVLEVSTAG